MTIKISAICGSEGSLEVLRTYDHSSGSALLTAYPGSVQTLGSVLRRDQPDVLLLDCPVADEKVWEQIELALTAAPGTHMVVASPDRSVEFLKRAMRAGVREVLPTPISSVMVQQLVQRVQGHPAIATRHRETVGLVIAMVPAKGGAGSTFLATNLAFAISEQGKQVALLDLNLYFGDASIFLGDKDVISSTSQLAGQAQRLDAALLDSSMIKVTPRLHLLAASESPEDAATVSAEGVEKIIELARSQYDFVLLDISSMIDQVAIKALDLADIVYLTLQLNLPFIRAARDMATAFRHLGYAGDKLRLVVNRFEKNDTINLADVEKATALKIDRTIPNSHAAVSASINEGVPVFEMAPRDPVAQALRAWAQSFAPPTQPAKKAWWQRMATSKS